MELMIEMLRNRADVNAQDSDGTTPIHRLDVTGCDWAWWHPGVWLNSLFLVPFHVHPFLIVTQSNI